VDEVFANLLGAYGPFAIFLLLMLSGIGISLAEDLIVIPAGILIGHGTLEPLSTGLCAYAGVVASDLMWFTICHRYGTPLLHKRWFKRVVHPRRLLEAKHQIEARGAWVIVMARFIPGSRTTAITAAGVLHLSPWKFFRANSLCALITVPLQLGVGYAVAVGVGTREAADLVTTLLGVVAVILALLLILAGRRRLLARRQRLPRARAAWLRRFRERFRRQ
jgi:membrane protein DedA with SNARE-associated domain